MMLAPEWMPRRDPSTGKIIPEGKLWDFIEKIALSRREGKNRRDGATVSTRVLRLADEVGQKLFTVATGDTKLSAEDEEALKREKDKARRKSRQSMANL